MADEIAGADFDFSFNYDVRLHDRFLADRHLRPNNGKRPDLDAGAESARPDRQSLSVIVTLCSDRIDFSVSQHACFLEAEIAGIPFRRRADDDVIEQLDLQ